MKWLIYLLFFACGAGCGTSQGTYDDALRTWTRKDETYEDLESRVFARATWFSPAFAAAYATYRAERLGMSRRDAEAERTTRVAAAEQELRFFVALVTNSPFWNDLNRGEQATLRARLMVGGEAYPPSQVDRVSDDELADLAPFFPYADALFSGYWVVFSMPPETLKSGVHLRIAGPPAIVNLNWEVQ